MAEDFDVDAMLEAAYLNKSAGEISSRDNGHYSHSKSDSRDRDMHDDVDRKDRKRSRSRERRKRDRGSRSRSREHDGKERKRGERSRRGDSNERERERGERHRSSRDHPERIERDRGERGGRDRDPERRRRSRSKDRESKRSSRRSRSRERGGRPAETRRSRTPPRLRLGPKKRRSMSPLKLGGDDTPLSPEERDSRTVFCMQLSQRVRARDLEDFFSSVGKVRDVRMITCNKTRRFKGIAYVEFKDIESVALALGLGGQRLMGVPIIVQPSQAEKNRAGQIAKAGAIAAAMATASPGPMKLYVGSLHFNITEEMLRGIFEPFGKIDEILLMKDHETGRSKGFGFITFHEGEDAKRAMEQLNGFEIAGRPMKVGYVTEKSENNYFHNPQTFLDTDEMDRAGVNLGVTGRLQLMAKLAEGTDLKLPEAAATALNMQNQINQNQQNQYNAANAAANNVPAAQVTVTPPIATHCFMLSNMFDPPQDQSNPRFEMDIRDEVLEACIDHGGAVHIYVDMKSSQGNVYVKCPTVSTAVAAVNTLHGRWFGGRVITAAYVPLLNYHSLFPESMAAQSVLRPTSK